MVAPRLIVRPGELLELVGMTPQTAIRLGKLGQFPKRRQLGPRATGWLMSEIEEWLASRPPARNDEKEK